jgi:hypothetical protein
MHTLWKRKFGSRCWRYNPRAFLFELRGACINQVTRVANTYPVLLVHQLVPQRLTVGSIDSS